MSENTEQEARNLGWVPQEEFRGDPGKWVDAETFVERGHTIMPILKSNNKKLEEQLRSQAAELEPAANTRCTEPERSAGHHRKTGQASQPQRQPAGHLISLRCLKRFLFPVAR